jgi:hypothetical protein
MGAKAAENVPRGTLPGMGVIRRTTPVARPI